MRHYQPKSGGKHRLPHNLYMQIQYKIRDIDRLKSERQRLPYTSSPSFDGCRIRKTPANPAARKAIQLAQIDLVLGAFEQSAREMKLEYTGRVLEGFDPIQAYQSYDYFNYVFIRRSRDEEGPLRIMWNY